MNSESDPNNLDSGTPHHDKSLESPEQSIEFIGDVVKQEPLMAEIVESEDVSNSGTGSTASPNERQLKPDDQISYIHPSLVIQPMPIAAELSNLSANGGAVGAIVLGIWSILCSLITPFSLINAFLALGLGAYGMTSKRKTWAFVGIILGLIGGAMSLMETNEILSDYFAEEAAS